MSAQTSPPTESDHGTTHAEYLVDYSGFEVPASRRGEHPIDVTHRELRGGTWWRAIPAYSDVDEETFLDHKWQARNSATNLKRLLAVIEPLVPASFVEDIERGLHLAPMAIRISPYVLSLIDWDDPVGDPLRRQFIPLGSALQPDHPELDLDSLHEQQDAPVEGLTHRYPDKALFLPLNTCPVYCRFCTRSYAIGLDTDVVEKVALRPNQDRWKAAFAYIASQPQLEDIVISGGDAYNLRPDWIREIGHTLLSMENIRRLRIATKGPAIMPQKILTDDDWLDAITEVVERGRQLSKEVVIHTHFNHPNEATVHSKRAMDRLMARGIVVRNQAVLQAGVNDEIETMQLLTRRLGYLNVHPYYVYMHDLVKGVEDLRTSLATGLTIEKAVRGVTAGFNTPTFVVDAPGGGGKRNIWSFETYDRDSGISVYTAPSVKPGEYFLYVDPLHTLTPEAQARWADPHEREEMKRSALDAARSRQEYLEP